MSGISGDMTFDISPERWEEVRQGFQRVADSVNAACRGLTVSAALGQVLANAPEKAADLLSGLPAAYLAEVASAARDLADIADELVAADTQAVDGA